MSIPHQPQAPTPPFPEDPTKATRHLCAGAYLDETFRNESLRRVYYQPKRLVAPSYGFDLVPVLAHCLRARNAALVRDAAIVLTLAVAACVSGVAVLLVLAGMANLQVTVAAYGLVRDTIRKLRASQPIGLGRLLLRFFLLIVGSSIAYAFWFLTILAAASRGAAAALDDGTGAGAVQSTVAAMAAGSLLIAVLVFVYPLAFSIWRQAELGGLTPGCRVTAPVRTARLDEIARQQRGNTVVYGGFRPYVGSGGVVETWGFAQRLVRPEPPFARELNGYPGGEGKHVPRPLTERDREFSTPPFTAPELVAYVRQHLQSLLPSLVAEEQVAGLTIEDRVLLAGTEVSYLSPFLPAEVVTEVIRHPTTPARHYLACQVFAWGGELITTVYVHIAVQGRSLYLELTTTALPPCDERFRVVDTVDGTGARAWLRAVGRGLADTPQAVWRSPVNLAGGLINLIAASGGQIDTTRLARGYDYGALVGVRELGSDPDMRNLTQLQDVAKYRSLIERRVIAAVLDFLDEHGIDTIEYRTRATAVLNNNGVLNTGDGNTFHGPVAGRDVNQGVKA